MKQPIVDPFVPAPGQLARSRAMEAARRARPSGPKLENRRGSIDGVVQSHDGRAQSPVHQPYHGPAGSLHIKYAPHTATQQMDIAPRQANVSRPAPTRRPIVAESQQPARQSVQQPVDQPQPAVAAVKEGKKSKPKKEGVSTLWLMTAAAFAGIAMFSVVAGQIAIAIYGVLALWRRWPSQQNFALVMVMFGGIILASLVPAFKPIADNLAVYAFLLLCIGTVSLAIEVRRDTRQTVER